MKYLYAIVLPVLLLAGLGDIFAMKRKLIQVAIDLDADENQRSAKKSKVEECDNENKGNVNSFDDVQNCIICFEEFQDNESVVLLNEAFGVCRCSGMTNVYHHKCLQQVTDKNHLCPKCNADYGVKPNLFETTIAELKAQGYAMQAAAEKKPDCAAVTLRPACMICNIQFSRDSVVRILSGSCCTCPELTNAYHVACIAEQLQEHGTCPQCCAHVGKQPELIELKFGTLYTGYIAQVPAEQYDVQEHHASTSTQVSKKPDEGYIIQ